MTVKTFAAIDVGSFELELGIFEISASAGIREIDHVRHALALGKDTYNDGRLSHEIVEEMCEVLNKFREVMKTYRVSDYRAFASSALREARNSQMVLDRILVRTGLRVRTMNNSELRFKSYKAVAAREEEFQHTVKNGAALMDVGFGSTQLSLFDEEVLVSTQNLLLGVLRLSEMSAHWRVDYRKIPAIIDELVENELYTFRKIFLKEHQIETLIATGETMNYMISRGMHEKGGARFTAKEFGVFCEKLIGMSSEEIQERYELPQDYAEVLIPSAILYRKVLDMTGASYIWAPGTTLCDGIAAEYAQENRLVRFHHDFEADILSTARQMAKRYRCHGAHVREVERSAEMIFDATKKYHGLGARERLLLKIAATLHDCGKFVSITRGSESSYQIIMDTEIIGISHLEREVVANIVRYNIQEYAYDEVILESDLSQYAGLGTSRRELTILIAKLTAILRLANSMDRSHRQKLSDSRIAVRNGSLVITTDGPESIVLEQYSFDQKADFFEEVFGIRPVLRQKRGV